MFVSTTPQSMKYVFALESDLKKQNFNGFFYEPFNPQKNMMLEGTNEYLDQVLKKDVLFSYPYEDINQFITLLDEASKDDRVLSIKVTIYRLVNNSKIVQKLVRAAENGKDVTVVMELQARFDEENNLYYADTLYDAGCKIIYGIGGYKVHSKITLITLNTGNEIKYITQIGTGNYNETTSKLYTDLSLITADDEIGEDAVEFFKNVSIGNIDGVYNKLLVSPTSFKQNIIRLIDEEIEKGSEGRLYFKFNSFTDKDLMIKLSEASQAGVKIRLLIRGITCMLPGINGFTDNIEIRSIVGRYLEHPRIYKFGTGEEAKIYIGSADLMTRNTERRVEIATPLFDKAVKEKVVRYLDTQWKDNIKARRISPTGEFEYINRENEVDDFIAQDAMMKTAIKIAEDGYIKSKDEETRENLNRNSEVHVEEKEGFFARIIRFFTGK